LPAISWNFTTRAGSWDIVEKVLKPGQMAPAIEPRIAVSDNGSAVIVWTEDSGGCNLNSPTGEFWGSEYRVYHQSPQF